MEKISTANRALTIMVGAGAIADFEVFEAGSEIFVRVGHKSRGMMPGYAKKWWPSYRSNSMKITCWLWSK